MLVSTGESIAGISALPGIPLYLDYEDSYDVHVRRMRAIAACHPTMAKADVRYQACTEPLVNLTHTLLRRIQAEAITFVVLDSLAAATGGDAGAEAATKVFRAIRSLHIGALIIAHIPKSPAKGKSPLSMARCFTRTSRVQPGSYGRNKTLIVIHRSSACSIGSRISAGHTHPSG